MDGTMKRGLVITGLLLLAAVAAVASPSFVSQLPFGEVNSCLNCHLDAQPVDGQDLNPFGRDFQAAGKQWNETLALLDSDGDGCSNGVELGDANGNGEPDQGITEPNGNPGVGGDCTAAVPNITWGRLKAMFNGQQ